MTIKILKSQIILVYLAVTSFLFLNTCNTADRVEQIKPNILWLVSEDNSPYLGCYGDSLAYTPNLDDLASRGVRYTGAYANAPVCSAARSTLINGMYGIRLGIYHHRSAHAIPESFKPYPIYFREAGYYCTNNAKKDYNLVTDYDCWDESSNNAHYKNRKPGQPFFAIFNIGGSHESSTFPLTVTQRRESGAYPPESRLKPEQVILPPYHPDLPEIRQEWADYYDAITLMDKRVGERLKELEEAGLADSTIVIYYSDHGGGMARGKRSIKESGTRVPLIIYFPDICRDLAPAQSGETVDRLVSFVDLPSTMLSIMGAEIPGHMNGEPFLGNMQTEPRDHVFLYRGRMDARYDFVRAVKDERFRYIRNYSAYRPAGQPYTYAEYNARTSRLWKQAWKNGLCNEVQSQYWELREAEELYDVLNDPHEVKNLADDPEYNEDLLRLRKICDNEIISNRDVGFIPESMFTLFAGDSTLHDFAQSCSYDIIGIKGIADKAISRNISDLPALMNTMGDTDPLKRYWSVIGAICLGKDALPAREILSGLLNDQCANVRIAAAEAIGLIGDPEMAVRALSKELEFSDSKDKTVYMYAGNALQYLDKKYVNSVLPQLKEIAAGGKKVYGEVWRVADYLVKELTDQ